MKKWFIVGFTFVMAATLWVPVTQGATLQAGHVLYLKGYDGSGMPTILLDVYLILPNMMVEDLRYGGTYSYTTSRVNRNTTRMVIAKKGTGHYIPDDALLMDLTFNSATSGLLRNNYSAEYENGILVDTAGIRDGVFRLVAFPPGTPSAYGPSSSSDNTPYFSWSSADYASWYQVWVERNGQKYAEKWTQSRFWSPGIWPSGTYTWYIRAYNGVRGIWSSATTFTIASYAPSRSPTMIAPSGTLSDGVSRPRFSWQSVYNASWYRLDIFRNGQLYLKQWVEGATSFTPNANLPKGSYQWKIIGWSPDGYGPWSDAMSFIIPFQKPYEAPSPVYPVGTVSDTRAPAFSWSAVDRAEWYRIYLRRNGQLYLNQWVQNRTDFTLEDLPGGEYKWWIVGWGPDGYGPWSSPVDFTIQARVPGLINLIDPQGAQSGSDLTYRWDEDANATWYRLWVGRRGVEALHDRWYQVDGMGQVEVTLEGHPGGSYDWYVRAWSPDGYGPWSGPMSFSVP